MVNGLCTDSDSDKEKSTNARKAHGGIAVFEDSNIQQFPDAGRHER